MKAFKYRDKHVELLKKELNKIHSRSTLLNIRRSVRKASKYLNEVVDFIERYDSDLLAVKSVKVKNLYLARALQNERERSNRLLQEKIEVQSAYHDALREKAELKKENWNLEQMRLSDLEDLKNGLPTLAEFSDHYTKLIMKYDSLRKNISAKRSSDSLPPRSLPNISFGNNSNQPVSAVNPMVKGCVIQKPTINVRRVPFPNENRNSMFEYVNINSPILEESEENISPANNLTRRCANGLRNVLNVSNRRRAGRPESSTNLAETNYCDPVPDDSQVNIRLEPVVRLEDVTRLLQHSSIRISETPSASPASQNTHLRETANDHWSPEVILPKISTPMRTSIDDTDNALEGCSWMHQRPSVNVQDVGVQSTSTQNNSCTYQSRVQFTPSFIRTTPRNNHSYNSPLTPRSPLINVTRDSNRLNLSSRTENLPESEFYSDFQNIDDTDVVSSSCVDNSEDNVLLTIGVTQRKRKRTARTRFSSCSSETGENILQESVECDEAKPSLRLRKSSRVSRSGECMETKRQTEDKSMPKRSKRVKKSNAMETKNTITPVNNPEISEVRPKRRTRNKSSRILSTSYINSSDLDDSSHQSRPTRNRGNVSYKEPSLNVKLRRC